MFKLPKTKLSILLLLVFAFLGLSAHVVPVAAFNIPMPSTIIAQDGSFDSPSGSPSASPSPTSGSGSAGECTPESGRSCIEAGEGDCKPPDGTPLDRENCKIIDWLVKLIDFLSVVVGLIIVIMIVVGGIQYSASRDNPQATAAAKGRIVNAIIALLIYLFLFAFLQWIVPGGVL